MLTLEHIRSYDRDGFVLVPDVFSPEEIKILRHFAERERQGEMLHKVVDSAGRVSKLAAWTDIAADAFGAVTANPRIVGAAQLLLREEVYHWHSKLSVKHPRVGGAWEWHQDYGYWYNDGCLCPSLISCMVALDPATRENGCLKVIVGSHLLGRCDHGRVGSQTGADPERLATVVERLPVRYCEAPAGSVLFFHCNTFHSSEANLSEMPRRAYICCYNALSNLPYGGKGHGKPEPIWLAADDAILRFAESAATPSPA
jgi:ectoine hydroxylase-related dioxygenase (phytanoyl-CoA dioxygenase family)